MASEYDPAEFVDSDFQAARKAPYSGTTAAASSRAPSRDEVDSKVGETQQKLAELKRVQEELERERAGLEETRRRQIEFQTGRQETIQSLTRGVGLLEEAEFSARRDAEQMAKSLVDMRAALGKVETTNEAAWTKDSFQVELTRALAVIENARMEWNSARLKFPVLAGAPAAETSAAPRATRPLLRRLPWPSLGFGQLCKLGLRIHPGRSSSPWSASPSRLRWHCSPRLPTINPRPHGLVQEKSRPPFRARPDAHRANRRARGADQAA